MTLEGILYRHGDDDFELWTLDVPQEARDAIEDILARYADTGCSVRGTAEEIGKEME